MQDFIARSPVHGGFPKPLRVLAHRVSDLRDRSVVQRVLNVFTEYSGRTIPQEAWRTTSAISPKSPVIKRTSGSQRFKQLVRCAESGVRILRIESVIHDIARACVRRDFRRVRHNRHTGCADFSPPIP